MRVAGTYSEIAKGIGIKPLLSNGKTAVAIQKPVKLNV